MRILHAIHNFPQEFLGGTESYVLALSLEQAGAGHQVAVIAGSDRTGSGVELEEESGVRVHRLRRNTEEEPYSIDLSYPSLLPSFLSVLEEEKPDILHVHHYLNLGIPMVREARKRGVSSVVTLHDFTSVCPRFFLLRPDGDFCGDDLPIPLRRCLDCCSESHPDDEAQREQEFLARRAFFDGELQAAAAITVPSRKTRKYLVGSGILNGIAEMKAVPLGLVSPLVATESRPAEDGKLRLVFFGNVAPVKGVDGLLRAVAALDENRRERVSVLILGRETDGEYEDSLATLMSRLNVTREHGYDADRLSRLPAEADIAVFPGTAAETYSLVVDEALALGLPVIVSDRGAAVERVGSAGVVVRAGDVQGLTTAIAELIDDPGRLEKMKQGISETEFTLAMGAREFESIYASAMEGDSDGSSPAGNEEVGADATSSASFDPGFRFRPLRPMEEVPEGKVVVLAPHPDDEVIGCGGAIAMHAGRGDEVVVVHLTDGAGGATNPEERKKIAGIRQEEARAAGEVLGVRHFHSLDFPDGALRPGGAFLAGLAGVLETLAPDVLYVPSPFEHHPDHRATLVLANGVLKSGSIHPTVVLYEVNEPQQASYLLDITSVLARKRRALLCFESQRSELDVVEKTLTANRARTVNVDLAEVEAAEAFHAMDSVRLPEWLKAVTSIQDLLDATEAGHGEKDSGSDGGSTALKFTSAPVSAVISTWNKKDDVRENLLALRRQTRPPAEVIVVDNCSSDGTAEMIRNEFPEVRLIVSENDQVGACETFNMGFEAATEVFTAIMDDDVVAPPEWLETLLVRMEAEPDTTAMVSSKVVEPGMPEEFLLSEEVNRERYMATFRGCGTLARSDVLREAGFYDEKFFIYGNERDLAARVLGLGYRILQCPSAEIFHKTPFGMKAGKRSLYYHVRNFWLYAFKNLSLGQLFRAGWLLAGRGLGFKGGGAAESDATGTIGLDRSVRETEGGVWIAFKATVAAFALLPYCLGRRKVCRAPDFEPPVK